MCLRPVRTAPRSLGWREAGKKAGVSFVDVDELCEVIDAQPCEGRYGFFTATDWLERAGKFLKPVSHEQGSVIASHMIQSASTLRSRYCDANKIVRTEFYVRETWTNFVHDRLGLPRPFSSPTRLGVPPRSPAAPSDQR